MADASSQTAHHICEALDAWLSFAGAALVVIVAGCLLPNLVRGDEPPLAPAQPQENATLEPEEVARRFLIALLTKDKPTLERYMLSEKHSEVLWQGPPVSEGARRAAQKQIDAMQFRRLKPGDTVGAADGKRYTIDERQVNAGRVLLLPTGFHFPFALIKQSDGWKVKATTMIAARREALEEKKPNDR